MFYIILLILLGVLFLVAELVFLSGSLIGTILSLACYGGAIWKAFASFGNTAGIIVVVIVAMVSLAATIVSLRAKTWQRLSLSQEIKSSSMARPEESLKLGDKGVTVSRLSPMGKIEIAGNIYEAKCIDAYIDPKIEVEVTGFENFNVIVKKTN